jgi:uncharacterized damage-inducible protein DinB
LQYIVLFIYKLFSTVNSPNDIYLRIMNVFKTQYELLLGSRKVMLDFIERELHEQLTELVAAFNGSDIRYLLIHTANTYKHWLGNFGLSKGLAFTDDKTVSVIGQIRTVYAEADKIVYEFLGKFEGSMDQLIINRHHGSELALTPLQLFTHVLTHEFHHKGQIMTMCRLLGHTPPDTDIIRT